MNRETGRKFKMEGRHVKGAWTQEVMDSYLGEC